MSALLSQLEGRERRAECEKHDADLLADLRHRAAYLRQPEIADFRIGDLAQDVATELDRAHALAASHQRLKEALRLMLDQGERCNWFADNGDEEVANEARAALKDAP